MILSQLLETGRHQLVRTVPVAFFGRTAGYAGGGAQAIRMMDELPAVTDLVADPPAVHLGIGAWPQPVNLTLVVINPDIIARRGDWIDRNVATVLGIKESRAAAIKERGVDLRSPKNREEEAVEIYYRNLISYTLKESKERFESSSGMPSFPEPVEIVATTGLGESPERALPPPRP